MSDPQQGLGESPPADTCESQPILLRRKRRASSAIFDMSPPKPERPTGKRGARRVTEPPVPRTPTQQKRVRFSFPPDASTGLTQHVARTRIFDVTEQDVEAPRLLAKRPRRPPRAVTERQAGLTLLPTNEIEIQFKPIRQVLSERTKRRLTRNHLSAAMNEVEAERKSHTAVCQELAQVKQELEELVAERGLTHGVSEGASSLENRVISSCKKSRPKKKEDSNETDLTAVTDSETVDLVGSGSPVCSAEDANDSMGEFSEESRPITPATPLSVYTTRATSTSSTPCTSSAVQTDMEWSGLEEVQHHLQQQSGHLRRARLDLERLIPGETSLPLASPVKMVFQLSPTHPTPAPSIDDRSSDFPLVDAEPLITALFKHLHGISDRLARTSQALASAEVQRSNLRGNFNAALQQLEETRAAHASFLAETQRRGPITRVSSPETSENRSIVTVRENGDHNHLCEEQEQAFQEAQGRIERLEADAAAYERDRASLISALEKYRLEIKDLETLITTLESENTAKQDRMAADHSAAMENLVEEHAQAVLVLDEQLKSESKSRLEAESQIDAIVSRWGAERERSERNMGRLNVQIATLTDESKEQEKTIYDLQKHLAAMRDRVEYFVASVGGQLNWAEIEGGNMETDELMVSQCNPQSSSSLLPANNSWGLLTPSVEGGRFRDAMSTHCSQDLSSDQTMMSASIAGKVEIGRGRKKASSGWESNGIGTVPEEPNED